MNPVSPAHDHSDPRQDDARFETSFAQQRLWVLDQLEPGAAVYNIPIAVRLTGALNLQSLQKAFDAMIQRHEPLRTCFGLDGSDLVQIIRPPAQLALPLVDLTNAPACDSEAEAMRQAVQEARQPFDLANDLMVRARLFQLSPADHLLVVTFHHIAADGWALAIFLRELGQLYNAFLKGEPSPLHPLTVQYADFAVWQRTWLQGKTLNKQLSYWKEQLAGAPALLELPTDFPRPPLESHHGATVPVYLAKGLADSLNALAREQGCTLFMTLLAAYQTLLWRYTGSLDVVVGAPIANRQKTELEGILGCFINTLVLRTDLSGNPTFRELLARVQQVALNAYAHQDLPFEKLVEELQPPRDQSYAPLFQTMFVWQNIPALPLEFVGLNAHASEIQIGIAKYDLSLSLWETADGLRGTIDYATDLFEASKMQRMLGHWQKLLESIAANPDKRLSELEILTPPERRQLLVDWNATKTSSPGQSCVHQLLEAQAQLTPDAVALECDGKQLTYSQLNARANQLARHLSCLRVGPGVLVGLCLERSLDMVVGLLGILKAGGAYVPLDPDYPPDRLTYVLGDSETPVLVTQESFRSRLGASLSQIKTLCLDLDWQQISKHDPSNSPSAASAQNPAYVIYTSGSTGRPKGVVVPHRAVINFLGSMRLQPGLSAQDVMLAVTTLSFDIAGLELLLPLSLGAKVLIARRETVVDGHALARQIADSKTTVMQATPATWRLLLDSGWTGNPQLKILCGGEAWSQELATQLLSRCASLWNMYGPTETTIWSAASQIQAGQPVWIGQPIANTQFYILDAHQQPVPIGVAGELHIGGHGLALGYWKRPDLTAEKFINNPFNDQSGRLYKTGDLARYKPDGRIEFLGRMDFQVKVRGYRIELGEIEAVLGQFPEIKESVVVARQDQSGEKRLIAYFVSGRNQTPTSGELRAFLKEKLPAYMLPAFFVQLKTLPLSPGGKVNRAALPSPDLASVDSNKNYVPPADSLELQLTGLWEKILGIHPIGTKDNFYDLGGHSLLAVRLFERIQKVLGKKLPLVTIFTAPTIAQLAAILRDEGWTPRWTSLVPIQPGGSNPALFCVPPDDGTVLCFADLARHLGSDQPLYGLEPVQMWGRKLFTYYASQIRVLQPEGPYFLAGRCGGALTALHTAQQLIAQGQSVAFLGMFGVGFPPGHKNPPFYILRRLFYLLRHNPAYILTPRTTLYNIQTRLFVFKRKFRKRLALIASGIKSRNIEVLTTPVEKVEPLSQVYPGKVTLIETNDETVDAWSRLATQGVECCTISTGHVTMLTEPYVQELAQKLKACLAKAQAEAGAPKTEINNKYKQSAAI